MFFLVLVIATLGSTLPWIISPEIQNWRSAKSYTTHILDNSWDPTCSEVVFLQIVRTPEECLFSPPRST
ncbi:hypothetical protein M413DRAFT_448410 [Hebeloma cylindrosporum]|uniref:Secreted protein n=1 Tax=Hebeloma cylindrosporum TaxID=76867 RepID=A0A0C3C1Z6_HEBCY|nr:hypothetical protein M413DRAFT_448410 [Hebeloma cylindrosporum h7]